MPDLVQNALEFMHKAFTVHFDLKDAKAWVAAATLKLYKCCVLGQQKQKHKRATDQ